LLAVLSGAVAHSVFVGDAAGRRWIKDSSFGRMKKGRRGFFSRSDVSMDAVLPVRWL
jgi:hypothetical protein